jgi:predicted DNA-binding ribbon-helix-helix protein
MKTLIVKRSIITGGHKTSVSLEDPFWDAMKEIAALKGATLIQIVSQIDENREHNNLSSAIWLFVLDHYRSLAPAHGPPSQKAKAVTASSPSR